MTKKSYRIEEIFQLEGGDIVIGLVASNAIERDEWQKRSIKGLKSDFENRSFQVINHDFKSSILAVDIISSIANFKNVFLRVKNSDKALKLKLKDEIEIIQ